MKVSRVAPAKINLTLHVVARLPDGYHHLQSLVAFAGLGDQVTLEKADSFKVTAQGPFNFQVPEAKDNIIVKAVQWITSYLGKEYSFPKQPHIHLIKNLPVASGIGGGSSDAAATIAGYLELQNIFLSPSQEDDIILASGALGADVPLCLAYQWGRGSLLWVNSSGRETLPVRVEGKLACFMVLANPGVPVSTPAIFKKIHPPYTPRQEFHSPENLIAYIISQGNDLLIPAQEQVPLIKEIIHILQEQPQCLVARMSGSGATCFGLFADEASARIAQTKLAKHMPQAWIKITTF